MAKTPKPAQAVKPVTPAPSGKAQPQSAKKSENQLAQEAKNKQTPAKSATKKKEEVEDDDDESDSDDREEMEALFSKKNVPKGKTPDPEDEEVDEEEEGEDDEDAEFEDEEGIYRITDHLSCGNQVCICVPAGTSVQVIGAATEDDSFPLHITNACLGPDATEDDRATLVASLIPGYAHDHDHDEDEEEHEEEEDHDHDDHMDELEELVCGTLVRNHAENIQLDLVLDGDFILTNTSKETDIFVTARLIPADDDEDYDEDDYDDEEEEGDEDDDEDAENSRMSLEDEDDEDESEEDEEAVKARAAEMRKRLLENGAGSSESKKAKATPTPKVLDVKPAQAAAKKPAPAAAAAGAKAKPTADAVKDFLLSELKSKKSIKNTDIGTMIVNKFGVAFKAMGFEEKSVTKFLETHAKGKVTITADTIKYTE